MLQYSGHGDAGGKWHANISLKIEGSEFGSGPYQYFWNFTQPVIEISQYFLLAILASLFRLSQKKKSLSQNFASPCFAKFYHDWQWH